MADGTNETGGTTEAPVAAPAVTGPSHTTSLKAASAPPSAAPSGEGSPAPAEGVGAATGSEEGARVSSSEDPPPAKKTWQEERLAKVTAQLKEAREELARQKAEKPAPQGATAGNPEFDAAVARQAHELAAAQKFNAECDATLVAGREEFGEKAFNERVQGLFQLVDVSDRASVAAYQMFLTAALKTGDAKQVIFDLGADLNEAQRILSLPPLDMAVELTRRVSKKGTTQGVEEGTKAPRPLAATVGTHGKTTAQIDPRDPEKAKILPSAEWHTRRGEQRKEMAAQRGQARFR